MKRILVFVIFLLSYSVSAYALPMLYDTFGQIRFSADGSSVYEDFKGSFILSDPIISELGPGSTVGLWQTIYPITSFSLVSDTYTITQTGGGAFHLRWAWEPLVINGLDSCLVMQTSAGAFMCEDTPDHFDGWEGSFGELPETIAGFTDYIGGFLSMGGIGIRMTAVQSHPVPEPSTMILLGVGLMGMGLARWNRKKYKKNYIAPCYASRESIKFDKPATATEYID